jgi:histidinol-phosphate phosphatase family protein
MTQIKFQHFQENDLFWLNPNSKDLKNWGIIIDRDGVLIKQVHLLHKLEDIHIFPQTYEALKLLNSKKIPAILATNQTILARNLAKPEFITSSHQFIHDQLEERGVYLDAVLVCCHSDFEKAENSKYYKKDCTWRKPNSGMINFAVEKFDLEPTKTYGLGDKARDLLTYQKAGINDVLVQTGFAGEDKFHQANPTIIKSNILEAIQYIKKENL